MTAPKPAARPTGRSNRKPLGGPHDDPRITPEELHERSKEPVECNIRIVAEARAGSVWAGVYLDRGGSAPPPLVLSVVRKRDGSTPVNRLPEWLAWWLSDSVARGLVTVPD